MQKSITGFILPTLPVAVLLAASTATETTILDCRRALSGVMSISMGIPTSSVELAFSVSLANGLIISLCRILITIAASFGACKIESRNKLLDPHQPHPLALV